MSKVYDVNRVATYGGSTAMFYLKETLKNASWTVSQSSDGTTFYSASDGITTDADGTGGMNNANAWFFMVDPNGRRGFTAIRGTGNEGDRKWAVQSFEYLSGVLMGTSSLTTPPTTTFFPVYYQNGVFYLMGTGPTTGRNMFPVSGTFRTHTVAYDEAHNGVWPFYHLCSELGTSIGKTTTIFYCDPLMSGTTEANDAAPLTWKCCYVTGTVNTTEGLNGSTTDFNIPMGLTWDGLGTYINGVTHTYVRFGLSSQTHQYPAAVFKYGFLHSLAYTTAYASLPANGSGSHNASDTLIPITWVNSYAPLPYFNRLRGISAFLKINLNGGLKNAGRCYPDTVNLATNAYVMVGSGLAMPWPENILAKP